MVSEVGQVDLRAQLFDSKVKGFAEATYKFKQVVSISSTSAWKNWFYRETPTALAGTATNAIKGLSPGANFPSAVESWTKVMTTIQKYGLEGQIFWEDILANDVDVQDRTLRRIAEGVTKAVDDEIWVQLGGTGTLSSVTSFTIVGRGWDEASGTIIDDLLRARQLIAQNNYDTTTLKVLLSPKDYRSVINYIASKGAQFPNFGDQVARNGNAGSLVGMDFIVSNSVTASNALVCVPQVCATWKELVPLQTTTIEDKYKSVTIRAVEEGVTQLTDPNAVIRIFGTQSSAS